MLSIGRDTDDCVLRNVDIVHHRATLGRYAGQSGERRAEPERLVQHSIEVWQRVKRLRIQRRVRIGERLVEFRTETVVRVLLRQQEEEQVDEDTCSGVRSCEVKSVLNPSEPLNTC